MNAEIVARLQSTFKPVQQKFDFDSLPGILERMESEMLTQKAVLEELVKNGAEATRTPDGEITTVKLRGVRKQPKKP